ncbi:MULTISPECIES: chromate resistance protein ChrB domain-containing protein [Rhodanobacter]|uniref:chromate resistance protein ChrB domain-containing protein n=2 Tax=Rhodanobacteraceae TaxID=1775411 RepID=UPI00090F0BF4|nr:chromate resistance protein ChrB domain-containing protein [Rhodanobacter thiooxydans]TAN18188.1 MAG: hypothetical protein EPN35_04240 [Rhodanobacter sp.]UJJ53352.1 chromate resistance protein [Rhodanobacter thiooxydans]
MKTNPSPWLMLVVSLPGRSQTPRMRLWRALKGAGAEALRDGVYVLPDNTSARDLFQAQAEEVMRIGGIAQIVPFHATDATQEAQLRGAFDRSALYAEGLEQLSMVMVELPGLAENEARRRLAAARRAVEGVVAVDFFPGKARDHAETALRDAEQTLNGQFAQDEPHAAHGLIARRNAAEYRARLWATRKHLWIDRVASAWLIRRFIDPDARFLWLDQPADCPADALGFDFDGATFTHVGARVSFEVLVTSFDLDRNAGLARLGRLIHYLDIGGVPAADAAGFASVMAGARSRRGNDDDGLLQDMTTVLDCLYAAYLDPPGESP